MTPVITLDGPSGVGKGTTSVLLAQRFGWHFLDSGSLYRLTALAATNHGVELTEETAVAVIAEHLDVQFVQSENGIQVILEHDNVTQVIREEIVGNNASIIASHKRVRSALLKRQRAFAVQPGLVADGRDMGTVVFTDAPLKVFLTASAEERANRRVKQLKVAGLKPVYNDIFTQIKERDARDENRVTAPLKPADDAIKIDTTYMTVESVVEEISKLAHQRQIV